MKAALNAGKLSEVAKMVPKNPLQPPEAKVAVSLIDTRPQVRKKFLNLEDLAESIKQNGIIEPLVLHAEEGGRYRLIVGERRLRAAPLAGLSEVPVIIKRNLSEFEIRALQVAENNDREDLSAHEQALGVIEDVEKFGTKEAMKIWNSSEGWISKRVAVKKYGPMTREILEQGLSGDFEVLHCLNQLEEIDGGEAGHLKKRLEKGLPISRDEARNTLARVKAWKQQQKEMAQRRKDADAAREKTSSEKSKGGLQDKDKHANADSAALSVPASASVPKSMSVVQAVNAQPNPNDAADAAAERKLIASQLHMLRDELYATGSAHLEQFNALQQKMTDLDYELNQGEWVLWTGFLDIALPILHALGHERSMQYLKRVLTEMKAKPALNIWQDLHLSVEDKDSGSDSGGRQRIVEMPKDWRF